MWTGSQSIAETPSFIVEPIVGGGGGGGFGVGETFFQQVKLFKFLFSEVELCCLSKDI